MKCKHCGAQMRPLSDMKSTIDGRAVTRSDNYCPQCWAGYTQSVTAGGTIADMHWYDPGEMEYLKENEDD